MQEFICWWALREKRNRINSPTALSPLCWKNIKAKITQTQIPRQQRKFLLAYNPALAYSLHKNPVSSCPRKNFIYTKMNSQKGHSIGYLQRQYMRKIIEGEKNTKKVTHEKNVSLGQIKIITKCGNNKHGYNHRYA